MTTFISINIFKISTFDFETHFEESSSPSYFDSEFIIQSYCTISKMKTTGRSKFSQTYHQYLPSTIGITKQVHTADAMIDASSLQHDLSQDSRGSTSQVAVGTSSTTTTSTAKYSIADSYNTSDHCDSCDGITEVTGNRLYNRSLIACSKKLAESRCAGESSRNVNKPEQELHPILRKNIDEYYASDRESRACSTVSKEQRVAAMKCSGRLYSLSKSKQDEGKKRREAIALASLKRNQVSSNIDFGVLSAEKAGDMHLRGVSRIEEREDYLEQCRAEIEREIRNCNEFKLSEGAFAHSQDEAFQARVYQSRYGKMLELDRKRRELFIRE